MNRFFCRLAGVCLGVLVPATLLAAEGAHEGGHGGGHGAPHVEWFKWDMNAPPVGWLFINFAIFVFLVVRFGGGPLQKYLLQRHDMVRKAIEEATAAKQEAERKAKEFQDRVQKLDAEVETIKAEFKKDGERMRDHLVETGKTTAERILKDATLTIAAEEKRAEQVLREETARLALTLAETMVREKLTAEDQARLNADFIQDLRS